MKQIFTLLLILPFIFGKAQSELIDFESSPQFVSIDSLRGCWQIGQPSKTLFNTSYSPIKALMTDTINTYPDNQLAYAYFSLPTMNTSSSYNLSFQHRYDMENASDGGYIEYYDFLSDTWKNITTATGLVSPGYFIYYSGGTPSDNLNNGNVGWSGTSNGWITTSIDFGCALLFDGSQNRGGPGNAQLRFVFLSDGNNTSQEGWMIDDLNWIDWGGICASTEESSLNFSLIIYPTLTSNEISFQSENEKFSQISTYDFSGKLVEQFNFTPTNFQTLQLSNLSNGLYFYSVDEGKAMGKFIKE